MGAHPRAGGQKATPVGSRLPLQFAIDSGASFVLPVDDTVKDLVAGLVHDCLDIRNSTGDGGPNVATYLQRR